jgi:hypothetical protein
MDGSPDSLKGGVRSSIAWTLAGQNHYLARSRTYEPGSYFELSVSPWGHVRCTCPGFTYRGVCKHAEALSKRLKARVSASR